MRAALLSNLVTIQQPGTTSDAAGQPVESWSTVCTAWADVRHLSGMEAALAGSEASAVKASIRIRWRDGITPAMRVMVGSTIYQIRAVLPDLRRRMYVDLVCEVVS